MDRQTAIAWSFYDFATTPIAFVINAMYMPLMVVALGGSYSIVGSLSLITAVFAALWTPVVGAILDRSASRYRIRKVTIVSTSMLASMAIILMAFSTRLLELLFLFAIMSLCIQTGWITINAYLASEANRGSLSSVSGLGILMGYIGGGVGALLAILLDQVYGRIGAFGVVAGFLVAFTAIPSFFLRFDQFVPSYRPSLLTGTIDAARELIRNRSIKSYLVGSVLWGDAISTIMTFASLIAVEVLLVPPESAILFLGFALPGAALGAAVLGKLGDHFGVKLMQGFNLGLWAFGLGIIIFWAELVPTILVSSIAGFALGGNLTLSRALYAKVIPKGYEGRLFGFSAIFTFFGGAIGPLLTGLVADLPGFTLRTALLIPLAFVLLSIPTLAFIEEK